MLQYEVLGPVPLSEWGPPMERLLYLVLSRRDDRFDVLYAGDCERTDDRAFFVQHPRFKCWAREAGSEAALHLAVLPMFDSGAAGRARALSRIVSRYSPPCNPRDPPRRPPYGVRGRG